MSVRSGGLAHVVHWVMKQDGSFELSQPELDARDPQEYYNNYQDLNKDNTETDFSDEFEVETEVDPYDEVFSGIGLSQYSNVLNSQPDPPNYYNVVRF